jgi:hypothetical protein
LYAQNVSKIPYQIDVPFPPETEFRGKNILVSDEDFFCSSSKFVSRLSRGKIVDFYRGYFLSQGYKEIKDSNIPEKISMFSKGMRRSFTLCVYYHDKKSDLTYYFIDNFKMLHAYPLANRKVTQPQKLEFMPVYSQAMELGKGDKNEKEIGAVYIGKGTIDEIVEFYLKNMPEFGWNLTNKQIQHTKSKLWDAVAVISGLDLSVKSQVADALIGEDVSVDIEMALLTFSSNDKEKSEKKCIISILQFNDSYEDLEKNEVVSTNFLKKYGRNLINVHYRKE